MAKFRLSSSRKSMIGLSRRSSQTTVAIQPRTPVASATANEGAPEPIFDLAAVERYFETGRRKRHESNTDAIDTQLAIGPHAGPLGFKGGRIVHQPAAQEQRQQPDRNVDEEDPAPAVVVGEPAPQHGSDRRRSHDHDRIQSKRGRAFCRGKCIDQNGLRNRGQTAASEALQYPAREHNPSVGARPQNNDVRVNRATQAM